MPSKTYSVSLTKNNKIRIESNFNIAMIKLKSYIINGISPSDPVLTLNFKDLGISTIDPGTFIINDSRTISQDTVNILVGNANTVVSDYELNYIIKSNCCTGRFTDNKKLEFTFYLSDLSGNQVDFLNAYFNFEIEYYKESVSLI